MENYAEFVQLCLSKLKQNEVEEEEQCRLLSASSLIRFYGRPILPPLLSVEQREEMRRHRDEAQKTRASKKPKDDPRMAYVQTILHSIKLRKTPTLQELLQEAEAEAESSPPHDSSGFSVSCSDASVGTNDSISPRPVGKLKDANADPPKTSTEYSAFFPSHMSPQRSSREGCLTDRLESQQGSQPRSFNAASRQSLSSGYVTSENRGNTTTLPAKIDGKAAEEMDSFNSFYLHNTSNTTVKMAGIISHPPIDGEELERTGLESFFCTNVLGVNDLCSTSFPIDSVRRDSLSAEQPELSHLNGLNKEVNFPLTAQLNPDRNGSTAALSNNPDSQQTLKEVHVQKTTSKAEAEPVDAWIDVADTERPEECRPLSLQALLKKSQEYRRRQRMLRNQAKNARIHRERIQEQARARVEELSLSDKENDELCLKGAWTAEGEKTTEWRGFFIQSVEPSPQKAWRTNMNQREVAEGKNVAGETVERHNTEDETSLKNKMNSSPNVVASPKQIGVLVQQQPQGTFKETPDLSSVLGGVGKYRSVPVPSFCLSPVPCRSKAVDAEGRSEPQRDRSSDLKESRATELKLDPQRSQTALPSADLIVEGHAESVFAKSSLHIDQLESNLCCLKVLISDLESTVKENLDDRRQPELEPEENLESSKDSELIGDSGQDNSSGRLEDTQDGDEADELQRRQSFIQFRNMDEDVGPDPRADPRGGSLTVQNRGSEIVKLSKQSQVIEGGSGSDTQRGICKTEQLPSKTTTSAAQQMRIPGIFRDVTFGNFPPGQLSCRGAHPKERAGNIAVEAEGSASSPSLNQSYDVDTPSDLWFQDGPGPEPCSRGSHGQAKHLTPESGGEDQVGASKVKRRLLMHGAKAAMERNEGAGRAADSVVRPNSSTPKGGVHWSEGCGIQKQEQLKQIHAAQIRALQEEHRKQQEQLLQVLAARYRLLQDASPCSTSASRFGDALTFSSLSQRCRPLLAAAVKGFLTRRLLRTERVAQLVRTVRDTQQFLQAFQQQSASSGERCSRQDVLLQERVALQLRAARYEVYDVFFSLTASEQMQLIRWDRELAGERRLRRQNGQAGFPQGKSSLSAATQKSLKRKRERMIQKKAAECRRGATVRTGQKSGFSDEKPQETKQGQFKANPQRVPKRVSSSRPPTTLS